MRHGHEGIDNNEQDQAEQLFFHLRASLRLLEPPSLNPAGFRCGAGNIFGVLLLPAGVDKAQENRDCFAKKALGRSGAFSCQRQILWPLR
jgi:hypothetical protein